LERCGHEVKRKRVQPLILSTGLAEIPPVTNTSYAHPHLKVCPYLLRGVAVVRSWGTDIA
jgi:hypothetical protein